MQRSEVDLDKLTAWAVRNGAQHEDYLNEYFGVLLAGCLYTGIDFWVLAGQGHLETNNWTSSWWVNRGNPAGLGITGDPGQNSGSQTWETGEQSAFGHLAHMVAYVWGEDWDMHWHESWPDPVVVDKRFGTAVFAYGGTARTLRDLNGTWAIDPENSYHVKVANRANILQGVAGKEIGNVAITFGRVPKPAMVEMIVSKPSHNGSAYGYDRVAPRKPVGLVHHETQGRGTGQWYHDFFSCPNGERCRNALVDFLIDKAGTIFMFNDPFGTRAGWANGGGVGSPGGLEGDGPAFYAKFGAAGINQRLVSIEYVKTTSENFTDAQVQAGGALAAWIHDKDGQRWDEHPYTSKYGLVTSFLHFEFGTTNCGKGELDDITRVQAVTKGIMRKWQENGSSDPVDPDVPPLPEPEIPGGLTLAEATERFGKATRHNKDGTVQIDRFGFDPDGPISLSWAHRAAVEQTWPEIEDWYVLEDSGEMFQLVTFSNDWRLIQVAERQGWQWVEFTAVQS